MTKKEIIKQLKQLVKNYETKMKQYPTDGYNLGEKIAYKEMRMDLTGLLHKIIQE